MPTVRRSRALGAPREEIWAIVSDPHHLPRWWPRVTRVEDVSAGSFTQVLTTAKGVPVRADFLVVESAPPAVLRWEQQLVNTPFEKILRSSAVEVRLSRSEGEGSAAGVTQVSLSLDQRLRGVGALGGFMVRGAGRRQLDAALDGLEGLVVR